MIWLGFVARFYIMAPGKLLEEPLTRSVIGASYEVYHHLGFGFLESLYASALERELLGVNTMLCENAAFASCTRARS